MDQSPPNENHLSRKAVTLRLSLAYRHARLLRRLLKLIEQAEEQGLPLVTADQLPMSADAKGGRAHG